MTDTDGALAGYNAGDNVTYYEIDGSVTNDIGFIDSIPGNTGEIGKWIFRIDKEQLQFANCSGWHIYDYVILCICCCFQNGT